MVSPPPLRAIMRTTLYISETSNNKGANPKQSYQEHSGLKPWSSGGLATSLITASCRLGTPPCYRGQFFFL
jgi:hypothetical protein